MVSKLSSDFAEENEHVDGYHIALVLSIMLGAIFRILTKKVSII